VKIKIEVRLMNFNSQLSNNHNFYRSNFDNSALYGMRGAGRGMEYQHEEEEMFSLASRDGGLASSSFNTNRHYQLSASLANIGKIFM
jgi:predicted 3-demethylubiquinone-9 3-methyltransferase (glyoxalase superfamily)